MATEANTDVIDSLFQVPPAGFVKARNELVKKLKAQGQREAAEQAARLSRPTASVWASNQVARRAADLVSRLADVTARLQGGVTRDREAYAAAINQHRELLGEVRARIEAVLSEAGLRAVPPTVAAAVQNFRTGLTDARARPLLERGRLTEDLGLEAGGGVFGGAALATGGEMAPVIPLHAARPAAAHQARPAGAGHDRQAAAQAREREQARREKERALAKARAEAERQVQALRKAAHAAAAAREKQEAAAAAARRHLEALERALAAARTTEQEATAELDRAEAALYSLPRHLQ